MVKPSSINVKTIASLSNFNESMGANSTLYFSSHSLTKLLPSTLTTFFCPSTHLDVQLFCKFLHSFLNDVAPHFSVKLKCQLFHVPPVAKSLHHSNWVTFGYVETSIVGLQTLVQIMETFKQKPPPEIERERDVNFSSYQLKDRLSHSPRPYSTEH